jgi:hypothetical protein
MKRIGDKYGVELTFWLFTTPLIVARAVDSHGKQEQNQRVRQTIERLIDAGLVRVYVGLESGSATQKRRYGRKETVADTAAALEVLRELGLDVDVGFIMFDPHLTVREMLENVRYFREGQLVKHNTWPFRPLVVNEGTLIKQRLAQQGLLTGIQDPDFMAYEYTFSDPDVARIASSVIEIAKETGPLFYALKTISKTHWKTHETAEMRFARQIVERNAHVYLDLMENLARAALEGPTSTRERRHCGRARAEVVTLMNLVEEKLRSGLLSARNEDERTLERHLETFHRDHLERYRETTLRMRSRQRRKFQQTGG